MVPCRARATAAALGHAVAGPAKPEVLAASGSRGLAFPRALLSCARHRGDRSGRRHGAYLLVGVALTWLSLGQVCAAAGGPGAREIVAGVARLLASKSSTATVEMQIVKPFSQRTILMRIWSLGEAKILVRLLQPPEDAGTAMLKLGDQAWMYLPKVDRTIAMPPSMMTTPWMGSDFTLNDLVNQARLAEDYAITTAFTGRRNGVAVTEYALTPKPAAPVVWGRITLEVRQSDLMPVWERYYDDSGALIRELKFSDYARVSGRLIPTRLEMQRTQRAGEYTIVTYHSIQFDVPISGSIFSLQKLKP